MGYLAIEKPRKTAVHGRGDLSADAVGAVGLELDPNDRPRRHANIVGWPPDKPERKMLALELSKVAELILRSG